MRFLQPWSESQIADVKALKFIFLWIQWMKIQSVRLKYMAKMKNENDKHTYVYICILLRRPREERREWKLIFIESNINFYIINVTCYRLWRHQKNPNRAIGTGCGCVKIVFSSSFMGLLCPGRNKVMYIQSWGTTCIYAFTRVLFWCLFPSLLRKWAPIISLSVVCE